MIKISNRLKHRDIVQLLLAGVVIELSGQQLKYSKKRADFRTRYKDEEEGWGDWLREDIGDHFLSGQGWEIVSA